MALREIHYRLLNSEHGLKIAQMAVFNSSMHRISEIIQKMKTELNKAISVEELAAHANMSVSSFHAHFKEVTAMSPLQYQKRLRLTEARRILMSDEASAANAAYKVGYESATQFNREYARMFGAPPMKDIELLRTS